jgi:hypothetical protein
MKELSNKFWPHAHMLAIDEFRTAWFQKGKWNCPNCDAEPGTYHEDGCKFDIDCDLCLFNAAMAGKVDVDFHSLEEAGE